MGFTRVKKRWTDMWQTDRTKMPETRRPSESTSPPERWRMIFHGRVQGVGFRYQAASEAKSLGLTGWVRNCWDGSVELEAQGAPEYLLYLRQTMAERPYISIDHVEITHLPLERENDFRVRY